MSLLPPLSPTVLTAATTALLVTYENAIEVGLRKTNQQGNAAREPREPFLGSWLCEKLRKLAVAGRTCDYFVDYE